MLVPPTSVGHQASGGGSQLPKVENAPRVFNLALTGVPGGVTRTHDSFMGSSLYKLASCAKTGPLSTVRHSSTKLRMLQTQRFSSPLLRTIQCKWNRSAIPSAESRQRNHRAQAEAMRHDGRLASSSKGGCLLLCAGQGHPGTPILEDAGRPS